VHELVLVLSDFYVSQETPDRELPAGVMLPGLQQVARFGTRSKIPAGWRPWLSRWLTGADAGSTATVAAAAAFLTSPLSTTASGISVRAAPATPSTVAATAPATAAFGATSAAMPSVAWMATPMHLIAGMTSVHIDRRSILRLDAADQEMIAADFQRVFHDSGFHLQPLEAGDFLMLGPGMSSTEMEEPARAMGASMGQQAGTSRALRKLGAEIEMWLHDHAINDTRRRRGEQPVTALWLWGGGPVATRRDVAANADGTPASTKADAGANAHDPKAAATAGADAPDIAFGRDSYLQGLWALRGEKVLPLPQQLTDVFSYPHVQRAVLVIEMGLMLQSNPNWGFFDAVADTDRRFIAPAVEALNCRQYDRLVLLANDYELTLRASDRFKFWRRTPPGLSGLQ
jgi:hypothetical protein